MYKINVRILEFKKGQFEGTEYANILARYDDRIIKFKLQKGFRDLSELVDKDVEATFIIEPGLNFAANLRIVQIEQSI